MRERGGRRGVGQIVRRDVNRLHGRDRAVLRGRDTLLQSAHFGGQRGLIADGGGHTAEKRGDFGAGLRETEDVIDEQKHVLMLHVAEILRHRKAGQTHAHTRSGRLVHLAEDQRRFLQNAGLLHFVVQVIALAGTFADAGEDGVAVVLGGDVVNQLLNQNGLADACAAEEADLTTLCIRADEVNDLDAGFENLRGGFLLGIGRRFAVNRPALELRVDGLIVQRISHEIENTAKAGLANGNGDGRACVDGFGAADKAVGGAHGNAADDAVADLLGNLGHDRAIAVFERNGVVQIGKLTVGEANIKDRSDNLYDSTGIWQYGHSFQDCSAPATISVISCVIAP